MTNEGASLIVRLWRRTIWHPAAIPPEEWKYRSLKRVWLPVYDVIVMVTGIWAVWYASPILRTWLPDDAIDVIGSLFVLAGFACLLGIAFPRLWKIEIVGKILVLAFLSTYAGMIWVLNVQGDAASGFVSFVVCLGLPLLFFRLMLLGEEIKQRRVDDEAEAARAAEGEETSE